MNKNIVKAYVAFKAALNDKVFMEARNRMNRDEYIDMIMNRPLHELPVELRDKCHEAIVKRYNLKRIVPLFAPKTVGEWLQVITEGYTSDYVLMFFSKRSGATVEKLTKEQIGSSLITRPHLITMVEKLEEVTGIMLSIPDETCTFGDDLAYLGDDVTYVEVAKFFTTGSEKLTKLRQRYLYGEEADSIREKAFRVYCESAEVPHTMSDEELLTAPVRSFYPKALTPNDWDVCIFDIETVLDIQIFNLREKVGEHTTVSELLDIVFETKMEEQRRRKK